MQLDQQLFISVVFIRIYPIVIHIHMVVFHCVDIFQFVHPFASGWTFTLILVFRDFAQCCIEHTHISPHLATCFTCLR